MALDAGFYRYWGKARNDADTGDRYHLLPYHCLDVAAVAAAWWAGSPVIRRRFCLATSVSEPEVQAWLLFFVALHDIGKFDLRFQLKSAPVWYALNPGKPAEDCSLAPLEIRTFNHGRAGYYWIYQDLKNRFAEDDEFFGPEETSSWTLWKPWLAAVTGHHGAITDEHYKDDRQFSTDLLGIAPCVWQQDADARQAWLQALEELFLHPVGLTLKDDPPELSSFQTMLAGFCSVVDWLGSCADTDRFIYDAQPSEDLAGWFERRLPVAESMVRDAGILSEIQPFSGVAHLLKPEHAPRQLQTLVADLPAQSGLTLIEAPTGSGKTETALAYAWQLLAGGYAESLIFALPTQATANAMFSRLELLASKLFTGGTELVLAHGRAAFQARFLNLKSACRPRTAQQQEEAWVQCGQWLAQSKKRVFLGQVGICTVDQVLVSVLPVRHNFVRGFGIGRSVLIVDEVHAYDRYMYGLLEEVLHQQRAAGGSAILLSATLPRHQKEALLKSWGSAAALPEQQAYPLVTLAGDGDPRFFDLAWRPEQLPPAFAVRVELLERPQLLPDEQLLQAMIDAAASGAQVCLVCNLVDIAQQTVAVLRRLAEQSGKIEQDQIDLFHARFVFNDRQAKEDAVLRQFGPEGERSQGRILVATQVVEQSLDLDFDWLITQLCPVDLLFQRTGRLHRHQRPRPPGFAEPKLSVLVPDDLDYALHGVIYPNIRVLWRTQQLLLRAEGLIHFPGVYRDWIEPVYAALPWGDEPEQVEKQTEQFEQEAYAAHCNARQLIRRALDLDDSDSNVALLTRDGEMGVTVVPIRLSTQGACLLDGTLVAALDDSNRFELISLNSLSVPAGWLRKGSIPDLDEQGLSWLPMYSEAGDKELTAEFGGWCFTYHPDTGLQRKEQGLME